jgi:hypothetical protein
MRSIWAPVAQAAISTNRPSVSGVATRVMALTLAYEIRPAASAELRRQQSNLIPQLPK